MLPARSLLLGALLLLCCGRAFAAPPIIVKGTINAFPVLNFDQPMLTWGNGHAAAPDIRIQPALPCSWEWDDDTTLQCHIKDANVHPTPATSYHVVVNGLWSQAGELIAPGTSVTMETARPEIETYIQWKHGWPSFYASTNQNTTIAQLRSHLRVEDRSGHSIATQWTAVPESSSWVLTPTDRSGHDVVFVLRALPGMQGGEGPLPGKQDKVIARALGGESFGIRVHGCKWNLLSNAARIECNPDDTLEVAFSQPLSDAAWERLSETVPDGLDWSDQNYDDRFRQWNRGRWNRERDADGTQHAPGDLVAYTVLLPRQEIAFTVPADLTDDMGHLSSPSKPFAIVTGDLPAALLVQPTASLLLAPTALAEQKMLGVNLKTGSVMLTAIGKELTLAINRFSIAKNNEPAAIDAPAIPDEVRRDGGLVQVQVGARNGYRVAYAGLQLVASRGSDEVTVWVTRWKGARPVPGATVELLEETRPVGDQPAQLRVLGKATSDADGFVRIPVASDVVPANLLVRASAGDKRSVMPLTDEVHWLPDWSQMGSVSSHLQWGVSDRPLYQPGDSVRYRLWVRDRRINHLVAPNLHGPLTVVLEKGAYQKQSIQTRTVTADSFGGVSGEFKLPADASDDDYCIRVSEPKDIDGPGNCFQVSRYEPAELWAKLGALVPLVHEGDKLGVDVDSGFYSGGPAGLAEVRTQSVLSPLALGQAFPKFAAYDFIDTYAHPAESFRPDPPTQKTGADGKLHVDVPIVAALQSVEKGMSPIPFGTLQVDATVGYPGHAGIATETVTTHVSRFRKFVGLRFDSYSLQAGRSLHLQAVAISDTGVLQPDEPIHVTIQEVTPGDDEDASERAGTKAALTKPAGDRPVITECTVASGGSSDCAVNLVDGNNYRIIATDGSAAPAHFVRYASNNPWHKQQQIETSDFPLRLTRLDLKETKEPEPTAPGDVIVITRRDLEGPRDPKDPPPITTASVRIRVDQPFARATLLLTIQHGQILRHWSQTMEGPQATLEVPLDPAWAPGVTLAAVAVDASRPQDAPPATGNPWSVFSAQIRLPIAQHKPPPPLLLKLPAQATPGSEVTLQLRNPRTTTVHATIAMIDEGVLVRMQAGAADNLDPDNDQWRGALRRWSTASWFGFVEWNTPSNDVFWDRVKYLKERYLLARTPRDKNKARSLGSVEVTGSMIPRVQSASASPVMAMPAPVMGGQSAGKAARLRTNFVESAYWEPDLQLAPGKTRELKIRLPDNLTQWHVMVWAADADDGFARSEATVKTSLPVEARANAPTHLFPGDRALAEVSARGTDADTSTIHLQGKAAGAGASASVEQTATLPRGSLLQARLELQPTTTGTIDLTAQADTATGRDAVQQHIAVDGAEASEHVSQAGWLTSTPLSLPLPRLATGAHDPQFTVQLGRVDTLLSSAWTVELRDYVFRCWEQTLSRAIGASLASTNEHDRSSWPDADAVVQSAFEAAPAFVDRDGLFAYFPGSGGYETVGNPILTAYTLDAFSELKALGQPVPDDLAQHAAQALEVRRQALATIPKDSRSSFDSESEAILSGALADRHGASVARLHVLWNDWDHLSWYARSQLVRALAAQPGVSDLATKGIERLRNAGVAKGERRVLDDDASPVFEMGSLRRDQCAIIRTLTRVDISEQGRKAVAALERGLFDLYAGGSWDSDTQTSAQCLLALHAVTASAASGNDVVRIGIDAGSQHADLELAAGESQKQWSAPAGESPASLALTRMDQTLAPAAFVANIAYRRDQRIPAPMATGMHLDRNYDVLRDGSWKPIDKDTLHEGDWVRVTLVVSVSAFRHFVVVSDPVPGGWFPEDVDLGGVAGLDLQRVADAGSWWFRTRQLGTSFVRMYAEYLPPGRHELQYFAQVRHSGHFFAPPATAELMYGEASFARTAPEVVTILP